MISDVLIGMAGSGGDGIVSAGEALIAAAAKEGYHGMMTKSFGSQIRGGESSCRVRLSTEPVLNPGGTLDVAVALNWEDFMKFGAELPVGGNTLVIYDSKTGVAPDALPLIGVKPAHVLSVPIATMAKDSAGTEKAKNTIILGLIAGYFGVGGEAVLEGIRKKLAHKGPELFEANKLAFKAGVDYAMANPLSRPTSMKAANKATPKMLTDGNDMCAAAAIFAGCTFFGGYPITPSSEVMQFFSKHVWKYGGAVLQAEDEIAGIGAAVGASFAGKKAMTATSGPGMSLKSEIMGLATIAELPLVIVNVQRGGPSTGLPTKSEQGDLFQAVFSAHGDVVRPVLAPTCVADTFDVTVEAFNLAEKYQTPVIVLSDQEIAQRKETCEPIDTSRYALIDRIVPSKSVLAKGYERFKRTSSGVSPISHPGMEGGSYLASGIEHNEAGAPTASGIVHQRMNSKRFDKFAPLKRREDLFDIYGDRDAPLALVAWGSTAGVAREALAQAVEQGLQVKLMIPKLLFPVSEIAFGRFFAGVHAGLIVEQSHQGQLFRLLRMFMDVPSGVFSYARSGANPFQPSQIVGKLQKQALAFQHAGDSAPQEE